MSLTVKILKSENEVLYEGWLDWIPRKDEGVIVNRTIYIVKSVIHEIVNARTTIIWIYV